MSDENEKRLAGLLEAQRNLLLDLGGGNKLISFSHSPSRRNSHRQGFLRIVDEIPELIIQKLDNAGKFELEANTKDEIFQVDLALLSEVEKVEPNHEDQKIQVIEKDPTFSFACDSLLKKNRLSLQEKGINVLNIAIGFLSWKESKTNDQGKQFTSPLLLLPVQISKEKSRSGYRYFVDSSEDDITINFSLWRRLAETEGFTLPQLELDDDSQPLLSDFFTEIQNLLSEKDEEQGWSLKKWATLGIFGFNNLSIYSDLDFGSWDGNPHQEHPFLKDFISGTTCKGITELGDLDFSQDDVESKLQSHEVPRLITDADSTQYAVIKKALEGKSIVVQGPPGTGKSQTITNIIAALMAQGKTILFAAEKLAALQVVEQRLADKGLSPFCLKLHSTSQSKRKLHQDIKARVDFSIAKETEAGFEQKFEKLKVLRSLLNDSSDVINSSRETSFGPVTLYSLMGSSIANQIGSRQKINPELLKKIRSISIDPVKPEKLELVAGSLKQLTTVGKSLNNNGVEGLEFLTTYPDDQPSWKRFVEEIENLQSQFTLLDVDIDDFDSSNYTSLMRGSGCEDEIKAIDSLTNRSFRDSSENDVESASWSTRSEFVYYLDFKNNLKSALLPARKKQIAASSLPTWCKFLHGNLDHYLEAKQCLDSLAEILKNESSEITGKSLLSDLESLERLTIDIKNKLQNNLRIVDIDLSLSLVAILLITLEASHSDSPELLDEIFNAARTQQDFNSIQIVIECIREWYDYIEEFRYIGIDCSLLRELSSAEFENALSAMKSSGPLGCLFSRDIRKSKSLWSRMRKDSVKCPRAKDLARVYIRCRDYLALVERQRSIDIPFDDGRIFEIAMNTSLSSLDLNLLETLYQNTDSRYRKLALFRALEGINFDNILLLNRFKFLENCTLSQVPEACFKVASSLKSYRQNLPKGIFEDICEYDYFSCIKSSAAIDSYLTSVQDFKDCFEGSNFIDCTGGWKWLNEEDLRKLIAIAHRIGCNEYSPSITNKLLSSTINEYQTELRKIDKAINAWAEVDTYSYYDDENTTPLYQFFASSNARWKVFIDWYDSVDSFNRFKQLLSQALKFSSLNANNIIEYHSSILRLSEFGFSKGAPELASLSLETSLPPDLLLDTRINSLCISETDLDQKIARLSGRNSEDLRAQFSLADQSFISAAPSVIAGAVTQKTAFHLSCGNASGSPKTYTQGALIKHEIKKQRSHLPTRMFIRQSFDSLTGLMPCWFMSPASVAQTLPKKTGLFDVLIIDEASQMKPEFALGMIARAKQVVVVGDRKQLPPTNSRFERRALLDEEFDEGQLELEDNESILELADKVLDGRSCSLGWHYRSRHQSLINFSNYHFYDNKLTVFASMDVQSAVHLRQVENPQYSSQVNLPEVLEVIAEIKKQVHLDPTKSILVATMNSKQASEIEMAWEAELQSSPDLEEYVKNMTSSLDELVIKNLENVQGDERDIVIISTVYGPDSNGRVYQRFGDLVNKQGWRWLNVLLTRAKHCVVLVTSLLPSDIEIKETTSLGVRALKNYLIYAKTGQIDTSLRQASGDAESPFEESVRDALLSLGT